MWRDVIDNRRGGHFAKVYAVDAQRVLGKER